MYCYVFLYSYLKFTSDMRMIGETILICGFCVSAGLGIEDVIKKKDPVSDPEELPA